MIASFVLSASALLATQSAEPQDLTRDFSVPDGMQVDLWAASPGLFNPTAIDVDLRGRVWVAEAVNYRQWGGRNPGLKHPGGDRIVICEDADQDGAADTYKVFVQDPELTAPLGIMVQAGKVYVSCSPNLFVYSDHDGDDRADEREVFLTGFGGRDHDHGLHSLTAGPDGRFYLAVGNAGPHHVTDADGWTLRSGSIYRGGGPLVADNKAGLQSADGRVWTGGLILRVDSDGGGLRPLAHNFRNNYEVGVDSFGNLFQSDNDDDGNAACRTLWCMEGGNYGYFSADGSRSWQADRRPGQTTQSAHWHQADPGFSPAGTINGAGGPTGVAVYEGRHLAQWLERTVLNADAGAGVVYAHRITPRGAGFELVPVDFLRAHPQRSERTATWFRPSDVAVGNDGSVFVADWFDPAVGGHLAGDRAAYGRILRIHAPRAELAPARCRVDDASGALAAFRSPAPSARAVARAALGRSGVRVLDHLTEAEREQDRALVARALWQLADPALADHKRLKEYLAHADADLRVTALRALRAAGALELGDVRRVQLATDPSAAVRRELALGLQDVEWNEARALLLELAHGFDGQDRDYLEAFGVAARGREDLLYNALVSEFGFAPREWDARFAGLAWRLHPPQSVPAFAARALDETLDVMERRRALDALAFIDERDAAEAVLTTALAGPQDLRSYANFWLRARAESSWRAYDLGDRARAGFHAAERVWQSPVVRSGLVQVEVDVCERKQLWLVVTDAGDGNSCDWADWIEPRFVNADRRWVLGRGSWSEASSAWGAVRADRNCVGDPLQIGEQRFRKGIGTHAASSILFDVPDGATHFVARAGVDAGGTRQAGGETTSVQFEVWLSRSETPSRVPEWRGLIANPTASERDRAGAARALAQDPEGALFLVRAHAAGELAPDLVDVVAAAVFTNPDLGVRSLASGVFVRPGEESVRFAPVAELAQLSGDARRGREIISDSGRSLCLTCHSFRLGDTTRGRDVGPGLTRVREKFDRAELFDAILNPSAAITLGYDTWLVETQAGLLHSGFLLADGETLVLKDSRGERHVIAAEDVAQRSKNERSLMPDGVATGLEQQELVDLVTFLMEDHAAAPSFGRERVLFDGTSLADWVHHSSAGGTPLEATWTIEDGVLVGRGSPRGYLRTKERFDNYHLTLEWRFNPERGPPGNSGVLLRMVGEDKVWPKSIEAQLQHQNAGDFWNIGSFEMSPAPERTSGRRTARRLPSSERPVGEWNRYDILVNGPRVDLRVNGELQNSADWCAEVPGFICLQAEGAAIEFREIRLRPIER